MSNLTYKDFGVDELTYLSRAYNAGLSYNAMVGQAQRSVECLLKHIIESRMFANTAEVMHSHNLRSIYEYIERMGIDLNTIRSDVMMLNNYYTHTRYPGRDAFMASEIDIKDAVSAAQRIGAFILQNYG